VVYEHDENGNLIRISYPEDLFHVFRYEDPNDIHNLTSFLKGFVDEGEDVSAVLYENIYDEQDRVIQQNRANGVLQVDYTIPLTRTTVTRIVKDALGNTLHNYQNTFEFIASGYLTSFWDEDGNKVQYFRDAQNNITRKVIWKNVGTISSPNLVESQTVNYQYDVDGNLIRCQLAMEDGETLSWIYTYDHGWVESYTLTSSHHPGKRRYMTLDYDYNSDGYPKYVTKKTVLAKDNGTPEYLGITYSYNTYGQLTAVEYDNTDREEITYTNGFISKLGGLEFVTSSDGRGNVVEIRDLRGNWSTITYDAFDRPTGATNPINETAILTYHGWDLVTVESGKTTTAPGHKINFTYDELGRVVTRARDLDGSPTIEATYTYDSEGNLLSITNALDQKTEFAYDTKNRPVSITFPNTKGLSYQYDLRDNLTKVVDAAGMETLYRYDRFDRLTQIVDALGNSISYEYELDKIRRITDERGNQRNFEYDLAGRMTRALSLMNEVEAYAYDTKGRLASKTNANGVKIDYGYNAYDMMTSVTIHTDPPQTLTLSYDEANNLLSFTDPSVSSSPLHTYTYDALNRIDTSNNMLINKTIDYDYNSHGNLERLTLKQTGGSDLFNYAYLYDSADRLTSITDSLSKVTTFSYDAAGRLTGVNYPNGNTADVSYDDVGWIDLIDYRKSNDAPLESFQYQHNDAGDITSLSTNSETVSYTYDGMNRLTGADYTPGSSLTDEVYTYDASGNRVTSQEYDDWAYSANHALTHYGTSDLGYDDNGNLVTKTTSGQTTSYQYDQFDRLKVITAPGSNATYLHDHYGRRIKKEVDGATRWYMYDGYRLIAEFDGTGNLLRHYNYIPGDYLLLAVTEGTQVFGVLSDQMSVARRVVDSSENVVWSGDYQAFGLMNIDDDVDGDGTPFELNLRFPGQYYDVESGLHNNSQRTYDPQTGRFLSRDPILADVFFSPNLNNYIYAFNNPLLYMDPDGRRGWWRDFASAAWDEFTSPSRTWRNFSDAVRGKMGGTTQALTIGFAVVGIAAGSYVFVASGAAAATGNFLVGAGRSAVGVGRTVLSAGGRLAQGGYRLVQHGGRLLYHGGRWAASGTGRAISSSYNTLWYWAAANPVKAAYAINEGKDAIGLGLYLMGVETMPSTPSFGTVSGVVKEILDAPNTYNTLSRNISEFGKDVVSVAGWIYRNFPTPPSTRSTSYYGGGGWSHTYAQ
jgi:RHS repeat-associated protein